MPDMMSVEPEAVNVTPYGVRLTIIVVSYNTRELTLEALRSAMQETRDTSYEILVVDNASSDGSADAIRSLGGPVRLIALGENIGFARANNLAAGEARGEFLLLLNPDTLVIDRGIDRLLAFADERPHAGIWGGRALFPDGRLNPTCCWRRPTLWSAFCRATGLTGLVPSSPILNSESYGGWRRDSVAEVDIVSGSFLLIREDLWRSLGGFDPAFFMYGEEADLCLRSRALGARPLFTPDARIIHYGGASETTRSAKVTKLLAAKAEIIRRHWRPLARPLGLLMLMLWPLSRYLALSLAAMPSGHGDLRLKAAIWREVWLARRSWLDAYRPGRGGGDVFPGLAAGGLRAPT